VFFILDEAAAAIGGWTALQPIKCVHWIPRGRIGNRGKRMTSAGRDFAAFAPEALRLARADDGAVLEGRTSKSVRFRHHDADRWATLALADDRTPTSLTDADHDN
jgi:hypothetical protein